MSLGWGARIKKEREDYDGGKSQQDFADLLGVSKNTLINYEKAKTEPTLGFVVRFYQLTGVTPDVLALGNDAPAAKPLTEGAARKAILQTLKVAKGSFDRGETPSDQHYFSVFWSAYEAAIDSPKEIGKSVL